MNKKPDTIVVSMKRSGLNWVRYCVEYFSKGKTPGKDRNLREGNFNSDNYIFHRTHDVASSDTPHSTYCSFYGERGNPIYPRMILIIRNYKEIYVRECRKKVGCMNKYFSNLQAYDSFGGDKLLVYYEDLVSDFSWMEKILKFLRIDYDLKNFDLDSHVKNSIKRYNKGSKGRHDKSQTKNNLTNFTFHSDSSMTREERLEMDNQIRKRYGGLFDLYLRRYQEI